MPYVIRCPHCTKSMQVPDHAAGKHVQCPSCKKAFAVPNLQAAAAPAQPAATPGPSVPGVGGPSVNGGVAAPSKPAAPATPTKCPSCGSTLLEGAVACMDCGFMLHGEGAAAEPEGPPNLCSNPACGVANPPGERTCQRCGNPLPTAPGTVLHNRYRVEKLLAIGGFGSFYLAADTKNNNRLVAIKDMICPDPQEFAIRLNFFRREAEILRSLETIPIVPRVYDLIEQGQSAHLVLEFIRGTDLLKLMETNGNKPFA